VYGVVYVLVRLLVSTAKKLDWDWWKKRRDLSRFFQVWELDENKATRHFVGVKSRNNEEMVIEPIFFASEHYDP